MDHGTGRSDEADLMLMGTDAMSKDTALNAEMEIVSVVPTCDEGDEDLRERCDFALNGIACVFIKTISFVISSSRRTGPLE